MKTKFPWQILLTAFSSLVSLVLLVWALLNYHIKPTQPIFYGGRAIYTILLLSVALALLGRVLLLRILRTEIGAFAGKYQRQNTTWQLLLLFDVTAPVYLASGVLLGLSAAVFTAVITQLVVQGYTLWRGLISWTSAVYRLATTG